MAANRAELQNGWVVDVVVVAAVVDVVVVAVVVDVVVVAVVVFFCC